MHIDDVVRAMQEAFPMRSYTERNTIHAPWLEETNHLTVFASDAGTANRASYEDNAWETIRLPHQNAYLVSGEHLTVSDTRFSGVFDSVSLFYGHDNFYFEVRGNHEDHEDYSVASFRADRIADYKCRSSKPVDKDELETGMNKAYELGMRFKDNLLRANA